MYQMGRTEMNYCNSSTCSSEEMKSRLQRASSRALDHSDEKELRKSSWRSEMSDPEFYRDLMTEFTATFCMLAAQCALPLLWGRRHVTGEVLECGVGMSSIVVAMSETFGCIGGAHMNPAITAAFLVGKRISLFKGFIYIIIQCIGAIVGSAFIYWCTPASRRDTLAATEMHPDVSPWVGVIVEIWLVYLLASTAFGATNTQRKETLFQPVFPISMIVTVAACVSPYTGSSLNPVRSLGPSLMMDLWQNHWVYWFGPILGGLLAGVVYVFGLDPVENDAAGEISLEPECGFVNYGATIRKQ